MANRRRADREVLCGHADKRGGQSRHGGVLPSQDSRSSQGSGGRGNADAARLSDRQQAHVRRHRLPSQPALNEFGLPKRNPLRAVGMDGGYVKASDAPSRQEGWFEVMVGKSLPRAGSGQVFAFVHRLEPKPNERMERFLAEQGVFPAQPTTFLSDGGETVRQAQGEFRAFGEPILEWFPVAMRTTQLTQSIKGLAADPPLFMGKNSNHMHSFVVRRQSRS